MSNADFSGSNLTAQYFNGLNSCNANYNNATLVGVTFAGGGCGFGGSTFVGANLSFSIWHNNMNAQNVDFSGANLTATKFLRANLTGATFEGATLTEVTWVSESNPSEGSTCPDGTTARSHDDTCIGHLTPAAS
jgi:uncharacterized protein YjbI with pentapeptide repeats